MKALATKWSLTPLLRSRPVQIALCLLVCAGGAAFAIQWAERAPRIQTDPRASDYDPVAVHQALSGGPDGLADIHGREPRHAEWGPAMESALARILGSELAARARYSSVSALECRTLTCTFVLSTPEGRPAAESSTAMIAVQLPAIADTIVFTSDPRPVATRVYLAFRPGARSLPVWERSYLLQRSRLAEKLRKTGVADLRFYPSGTQPQP